MVATSCRLSNEIGYKCARLHSLTVRGHTTMDVSGRGACTRSEAKQGSDDVTNALQCEQCQDLGRFEVASAFCSNCTDYLCTDCVRQHRMLRGLKDHIVLEGAAMPKEKPRKDGGAECQEHRGKLIELFCHTDHTLACVLCIAESHRTCADVKSISKLSTGLEQSRELNNVKMSAKKQKKLFGSCRKVIDEYRVLNGGCYDKSVEEFETFKSKIEAGLDLLGKLVYKEAGELKERHEKKLDSLSESLKPMEQELESLMSDMKTKETMKKMDQLFIAVKNNTKSIVENKKKIDMMKRDLHIQTYTFVADPTVQHMLDKMASTNPIKVLSGDVKCTADIDIKAPNDKKSCCISSLVEITPTNIVATDNSNTCLKHIDVSKKIIVTRRTLDSAPWHVAVIPGSRVAVTLPDKQEIEYFDTQNQLAPCGSIQVDGACLAVQSTEDTLIVSFGKPGKVEMMDFQGHVKRSFTTDSRNIQLFDIPMYLSLSPDHTDIYVSDALKKVATCLSSGGRVNWKYRGKHAVPVERGDTDREREVDREKESDDVKEEDNCDDEEQDSDDDNEEGGENFFPTGLATGTDGCVYICSPKTHSIHVVSPAGIRLRVIPVTHRIQYPWAVCYSKVQGCLYASSRGEDPDYVNFIRRLSFE